ncbi:hypothetical protein Tsubulata_034168 [Turnera subulata]|uniref:FYVE-type domain-containing protein n=1 Tax=Turnera subulata TaxID=218843 RepID=A0A9Q0G7C9_9ROSI|nr:hypothetical protein Tsubulata_034168 [Turnera subulata]
MADTQRCGLPADRDIDQAIVALKKGAVLLKYGRRGKPKFCPFHLSTDETRLVWYSGKDQKYVLLSLVTKIIPGQRTAIFQRYPRPEKEYQSFSLIYGDRSLDLICKDKDETEVWFVGLKALIGRGTYLHKWRIDTRSDCATSDSVHARARRSSTSITPILLDPRNGQRDEEPVEDVPQGRLGKALSDLVLYTGSSKNLNQEEESVASLGFSTPGPPDNSNSRSSASDTVRVSLSSAISSSSQGSSHEVFDALGDVFIWGEGVGDGILGGGEFRIGSSTSATVDAFLPKALESAVLDVHNIACGGRHALLLTKQGGIFSWGEGTGGRLGHGIEADMRSPWPMDNLSDINIEIIACGEYHSCAVSNVGDLYTWGDGTHNSGLLGHGSEASHWVPKKVGGVLEGLLVTGVSCGPWHTAVVSSSGQLFTFGDGTFGALGHGDHSSSMVPREVEALRGLRTIRVACGAWHTAAVVEVEADSSDPETAESSLCSKLFTWGNGDKGQLGHGDTEPRLLPECVAGLIGQNICQAACGNNLTVALTSTGRVYTMGSNACGQLGTPTAADKIPTPVEGKIGEMFVEKVSCGSYHIAILTTTSEVYTWGKGKNGQLGHGDNEDRKTPCLVRFLKDKQVKNIACGSKFTAIICIHKLVTNVDHSACSGCRNPFNFRRKRHNCYNCGLVFCKVCSSKKSLKASLAPSMNKPYRVCDDCFNKLKKPRESGSAWQIPRARFRSMTHKSYDAVDKDSPVGKPPDKLPRILSAEPYRQGESWHSRRYGRLELDDKKLLPALSGKFHSRKSSSSLGSTFLNGATKKGSPSSTLTSRAVSPFSGNTSPTQSADVALNDFKHMNDSINEEITSLRAQVEVLTSKVQELEAELERKSRQIMEVTAIATDEAEKCKSAKEVITSLTAQLKDMAERSPEAYRVYHSSGAVSIQSCSDQDLPSISSNSLSNDLDSNGNTMDNQMLSYETKQTERPQFVVQTEPGVYLTLCTLPSGGNELKRIRFSRKHFTEEKAEKWWAENGAAICERHSIQCT